MITHVSVICTPAQIDSAAGKATVTCALEGVGCEVLAPATRVVQAWLNQRRAFNRRYVIPTPARSPAAEPRRVTIVHIVSPMFPGLLASGHHAASTAAVYTD